MYPDLFSIPGTNFVLHTYGLMIMAAFIAAVWAGVRQAGAAGISKDLIVDLGILSMVTGILGAKINYIIQYPADFGGETPLFNLGDGGLSPLWGALAGAIPYVIWLGVSIRGKRKMHAVTFGVIVALTLFLAIIGARVGYVLEHRSEYPSNVWAPVLEKWRAGFVLYGGIIAGVLAGVAYVKWKKHSVLEVGDAVAPGMALGIGIGRLGCFFQGCCYGKSCDLPWAVTFPETAGRASELGPIHPTQIYELLAGVGIFYLLRFLIKRKKHHGEILMILGICYATWRFIVEALRADPRPTWLWNLSYSQWVSILVFICCALGLSALKRMAPTVEASE